jgi:hypothetical protein
MAAVLAAEHRSSIKVQLAAAVARMAEALAAASAVAARVVMG